MTNLLNGQRTLVTGGGTGLGYATARRLLEHGAHVTIVGRRADVLDDASERLAEYVTGGSITNTTCDVTDEDQLAAAVALAAGAEQRLDLLVANAGTGMPGPITSLDADAWRFVIDVNLVGTALSIKQAAPLMPRGSSIVTMSSTAGIKVERWMSTYSSTKAGLEMLTRCAAFELAPKGIRVNGLRPGWHTTEMNEASFSPEMRAEVVGSTLLGRAGEPEEVGDAVVWLSSSLSSFVTGEIIGIDGGLGVSLGEDFEPIARMLVGDEAMDAATEVAP